MLYPHQQKAIDYITNKFQSDSLVQALLLSGSIPHGFNDENSDIDLSIVVSNEAYEQRQADNALTYFERADDFYAGGYFDGKYITLDYLSLAAERGSEPTKFALSGAHILFDKTGQAADYIKKISKYNIANIQENTLRFLAQFEAWRWYCKEALAKNNQYLLDTSVSKLILFAARLILLENRRFFPYHKWLMKVLENCDDRPADLMPAIQQLLANKTPENIEYLYALIKNYKDWAGGAEYSWTSYFVHDIDTVWMRQDEFIENL